MRRRYSPLFSLLISGLARSTAVVVAAMTLAAVACGANVPTQAEATAALSGAIESHLTRTLPAATYCQTVDPDYNLHSLGQIDLVAMLQNVNDKNPLYDATNAGVILVELKEFRVDMAGRSPDPSCDAVHAQYKRNGARGPLRFAVVRTTLTPKGAAAGVQLDRPIDVATRELVDVTDIRAERGGALVTYNWQWTPTMMAKVVGYKPDAPKRTTASLIRSGASWTVSEKGVK